MRTLIQLYKEVIYYIENNEITGICLVIQTLHITGTITRAECNLINKHFDSISKPFGNLYFPYYFKRGQKEPRIDFINNIIKDLETSNQ